MEREIDKDLTPWSRNRWIGVIATVLGVQSALIFLSSQTTVHSRGIYPKETRIRFSSPAAREEGSELIQLEDSMLFSAAHRRGFSGSAWMAKSPLFAVSNSELPPPEYLRYGQVREHFPGAQTEFPKVVRHPQPAPIPSETGEVEQEFIGKSRLIVEGFSGWDLSNTIAPPVQFYNDAVGRSTVEAIVSPEGAVLSVRLLQGSGSKTADADALALSRTARFHRQTVDLDQREEQVAIGKLIFDWFALDLSQTNSVKR